MIASVIYRTFEIQPTSIYYSTVNYCSFKHYLKDVITITFTPVSYD